MPAKLAKEFSPELALPMSMIFNEIVQTGEWPEKWKTEVGIPLQKSKLAQNEAGLRIVSLTSRSSKIFEKFVVEWLMRYIGDKIDPKQFGAKKKTSTTHYLIEFISTILYNWDLNPSYAVLATLLDFSGAFNRISHNLIITRLAEMSVPNWLLKIIIGFLNLENWL